jgi:hypothetical protein
LHPEAHTFVADVVDNRTFTSVIEFGARDVNGTIRDLFPTRSYHGIDIEGGLGVDEVADAADWRCETPAECVVCCEVLEHTPRVEEIVASAYANLQPDGIFIVTCATDPREPHSGVDGGPLRDGEHYENVTPERLKDACWEAGFALRRMEILPSGDLYVVAAR